MSVFDCNAGAEDTHPAKPHNRPGLPALAYRLGTHAAFVQRMLARLPFQEVGNGPGAAGTDAATNGPGRPLARLTTRDPDDPTIALLDAWATVAHVLCFYQERIANEGFLRTATERRSVLELARAIGYELNPGVAASAYLAFTVEERPDVPGVESVPGMATVPTSVRVPRGTQIKSIPKPGQLPQTFETVEEIEARAEWNVLKPREPWTTETQEIDAGTRELYLEGADTQLQPGDAILIVGNARESFPGSERWDFRILQTVTPNPEEDYTLVTWEPGLGHKKPTVDPADNPRVFASRQRAALFGHNAPDWRALPVDLKTRYVPEALTGISSRTVKVTAVDDKEETLIVERTYLFEKGPRTVEILTDGETLFCVKGIDATLADVKADDVIAGRVVHRDDQYLAKVIVVIPPQRDATNEEEQKWLRRWAGTIDEWPGFEIESADQEIYLDNVYPRILARSWIALVKPSYVDIYRVEKAATASRTDFTLTSKCTRLALDAQEHLSWFGGKDLRDTVVYAQSEELALATVRKPLPRAIAGKEIELDRIVGGLESGQALAFSGKRLPNPALEPEDGEDGVVSEVVFIESVSSPEEHPRTVITLKSPLQNCYDRKTVTINGNVAHATHGETVEEVLGSGDGGQANQRFTLNRPPLTYTSAPTPTGGRSTLEVRVEGVLWDEAPSLYGLDRRSRSYAVRLDDDGKANVVFGDGENGARLPSGRENVSAVYRSGIGPEGAVGAGSLILLQKRPLGIRQVTNPLPSGGAAAPETRDQARAKAPLAVLTLERIVSLQDFEDFARAFASIGKAQAVTLPWGEGHLVQITVAAAGGEEVDPTSALYRNMANAIDRVREPTQHVRIDSYRRLEFDLVAKVQIDPRFEAKKVLEEVETALRATFAFEKRAFGQAVTAAEVVAAMQQVRGVVATDLDALYLQEDDSKQAQAGLAARIPATHAHWRDGQIRPAQLLLVNPVGIELMEMSV